MKTAIKKLPLQRDPGRSITFRGFACMLIVISLCFMLLGCDQPETARDDIGKERSSGATASAKNGTEDMVEPFTGETTASFTVYFSDAGGLKLVGEVRAVPDTTSVPAALVRALIDGPTAPNQPTLPAGTKLLGVVVENGTAAVDLSQEFVDNHPGGSSAERFSVYSIVNTLTELPEIDRVAILVNGNSIETIGGHLDMSGPFVRDGGLL